MITRGIVNESEAIALYYKALFYVGLMLIFVKSRVYT
jgi:hypothetical protein